MKYFASLGVGCVVMSCAAPPIVHPTPTSHFAPLPLEEFPGALRLLSGFDPPTAEPNWRKGDQALFALRLDKGGEVRRWLLHLEAIVAKQITLTDPSPTQEGDHLVVPMRPQSTDVTARVLDADGKLLTDTKVALPAGYLARGLLPAIDGAFAAQDAKMPASRFAEFLRTDLGAYYTISALLDVVRKNEALDDYFWQVVDEPSVWSVIANLGVSIHVDLSFDKSVAANLPVPLPPVERAFAVPMRIDVNDAATLFVDLLATNSSRPYAICGGIVAAAAQHPTRPGTTFRLQLLAARCGSEIPGSTNTRTDPSVR